MSEGKHTPGPWRFDERAEVSGIASADSRIPFSIVRPMGGCVAPIADIVNFPPATAAQTELQRANARLIASAPDLLHELIAIRAAVQEIADRCDAAINKATA